MGNLVKLNTQCRKNVVPINGLMKELKSNLIKIINGSIVTNRLNTNHKGGTLMQFGMNSFNPGTMKHLVQVSEITKYVNEYKLSEEDARVITLEKYLSDFYDWGR